MIVNTGPIVMTSAVHAWAEDNPGASAWVAACLGRHLRGDWGELDEHDRALNDAAMRHGRGRLLSAYRLPDEFATTSESRLWVITDDLEYPGIFTTILWPSDY
jgi:hypothetical protein